MTLLDFARGPALEWSLIILVVGIVMRLLGTLFLLRKKDLSAPKSEATAAGGFRTVINRMWPRPEFAPQMRSTVVLAYIMHIGLFVVVFFFAPHITLIKDMTGLSWGNLPNGIIMFAGAATIASMVALLIRRLTQPVMRMISTVGDYASWVVTLMPVLTGMLAYAHLGGRYENILAIHLLTVELLFVWFPFSKLMHAIFFLPSRFQLGAAFQRRGVKI